MTLNFEVDKSKFLNSLTVMNFS